MNARRVIDINDRSKTRGETLGRYLTITETALEGKVWFERDDGTVGSIRSTYVRLLDYAYGEAV